MWNHFTRGIAFASTALSLAAAIAQTPGVTPETLVLGRILPRTGVLANESKQYADGMDVLFERINKAGGIHGRKIVVKDYDDAYTADKACGFS